MTKQMIDSAAMVQANDVSGMVEVAVYASSDKGLDGEYARLREVTKGHWTGAKYDKERPFKETAKLIRQELAAASKVNGVLNGVKCRVRSERATHSMALDITVLDAHLDKMPIMNPKRIEAEMSDPHGFHGVPWLSQRGRCIQKEIERIANQYSFDRSDTLTDYHCSEFFLSVTFADKVQEAHRGEVERAVRMVRGEQWGAGA